MNGGSLGLNLCLPPSSKDYLGMRTQSGLSKPRILGVLGLQTIDQKPPLKLTYAARKSPQNVSRSVDGYRSEKFTCIA